MPFDISQTATQSKPNNHSLLGSKENETAFVPAVKNNSPNTFIQAQQNRNNHPSPHPYLKPIPKKKKVTLWFYSAHPDFTAQRRVNLGIQALRFVNTRIYKIVTVNTSSDFYSYLNNLEKDKSFQKKYIIDRIVIAGHATDLTTKFGLRNALSSKVSKTISKIMDPNLEVIMEVCSLANFTTTINRLAKQLNQRLGARTVRSFHTKTDDTFRFTKGFVVFPVRGNSCGPSSNSCPPKGKNAKVVKTHKFSPNGKAKITSSPYREFTLK